VSTMVKYQEDLRKWTTLEGQKTSEDRREWTQKQVEEVSQVKDWTVLQLEELCKKRGISMWSVEFCNPDFFDNVLERSKTCAVQEIIEEMGTKKWYSPHQLKSLIKEKNEVYHLSR
jgi:hypothetical protein